MLEEIKEQHSESKTLDLEKRDYEKEFLESIEKHYKEWDNIKKSNPKVKDGLFFGEIFRLSQRAIFQIEDKAKKLELQNKLWDLTDDISVSTKINGNLKEKDQGLREDVKVFIKEIERCL